MKPYYQDKWVTLKMKLLIYKAFRQYRESCAILDNPSSYLPMENKIVINGKEYKEVGRFPAVDSDIVSRFWITLPAIILADILLIPYYIFLFLRFNVGRW